MPDTKKTVQKGSAEAREKVKAAARRKAARKKAQRRRQRGIFFSALFFLAALSLLIWAVTLLVKKNDPPAVQNTPAPSAPAVKETVFPAGASVNGVSVAKMTEGEAREVLTAKFKETLAGASVTLENSEFGTRTLTAEDLGLAYDVDAALASLKDGGSATAVPVIDREAATAALQTLNDGLSNHASNAQMTIDYKTYTIYGTKYQKPRFVYTDGTPGMQLDYDAVLSKIEDAFRSGNLTPVIRADVSVSEPSVTVSDLKKQTTLLSQFSTTYYFRGTGSTKPEDLANRQARDANISLAVSKMGCIVLAPKESFSFNTATGKRTEEKGWTNAKAVYNGGYRAEPGGGVCQVSTTMFNALIRAGVTVTSHSEHSIPSNYVPLGWDATVDYGHIDFKFKNNKSGALYVFVYIKENSNRKKDIVVEVYGPEEPGITYKTRDELVETDYAVNPVTKVDKNQTTDYSEITRAAHDGYTVNIYVDKYLNGAYHSNFLTYTAVYKKIEQVTTVGGKATPSPAPTKTPKPTSEPYTDPYEG